MAEATEELQEKISPNGSGVGSALSGLASKDKLVPALATAAAAAAAGLAVQKGPDLLKKLSGEADDEAEQLGKRSAQGLREGLASAGGPAGKLASKLMGGGGRGGGAQDDGKTRRLPIQRWTDVAVPVEKAYEAWTKFDQYPKFMHRVLNVESKGRDRVHWQEKIWFSKREWEGRITERRENDRIAWKTTSGMSHKGVVSFHRLDDHLTRVMVTMEFEPNGMLEKMASGLRFVKRAVQADLARYKAFVEMDDVKGIEYRPVREDVEHDEHEDNEARGQKSDDERESERREREDRRQERRERVGAS